MGSEPQDCPLVIGNEPEQYQTMRFLEPKNTIKPKRDIFKCTGLLYWKTVASQSLREGRALSLLSANFTDGAMLMGTRS